MSVAEIEAAIEELSAVDQARLRDWLMKRPLAEFPASPKTGAELAVLWSTRFHFTPEEAESFAQDLEAARSRQLPPKPVSWE